ncbi:N-acetylmuramoyl-L-alanine amidase [Salinicoccus roseus]|uniref:N-acetylmuramoyl-L-alanine amidase family protein n=1 Tax=Salinicoccus roseus TaxID=45670 RepID=UPI002300BE50|nr:N-acetylmuramoyl-L-alanine amidase [Salinicoccus roseus]
MKRPAGIFNSIFRGVQHFLRYKKHIYAAPLFFLSAAGAIILVAVLVYNRFFSVSGEAVQIDIDEQSHDFSGTVIVIDPGHGGKDPGATSISGVTEDEIVFSMAQSLKTQLEAGGAEVILTRGRDEFASLDQRKVEGDLFISLHSDAMDDPDVSGFTTYYTYPEQKAFAESINKALDRRSYFHNRGVHSMNYQVTWQLDYPAVLVELGYLSNAVDDMVLNESRYQDMMVKGIVEGINDYLN